MAFTWGINTHTSYSLSAAQQVSLAQQIGLTSLRVDVYDASPTTIATLTALLSQAGSKGISVLPVIVPSAAAATSEAAARAWGLNVGSTLAKAFPSLNWEAGNELDEFVIKPGTTGVSMTDFDDARYALARGAISGLVDGIHAGQPSAKVAVGITGIHFGFLERLARDGVRWDITSEHYYAAPKATDIMPGADALFAKLAQFGRPIVMTEFNQQQGSLLSPADQTATLTNMMTAMATLAPKYNIVGAYIYELLDEPRLNGSEAHYGMASAQGVLSATGHAIQDYLAQLKTTSAAALTLSMANTLQDVGTAGTTPTADVAHASTEAANTGASMPGTDVTLGQEGTAVTTAAPEAHPPVPSFTDGSLVDGIAKLIGTTGGKYEVVGLYDGGTLIATTTADVHGTWEFSGSLALDVPHDLHVDAVDLSGNLGQGIARILLGTGGADNLQGGDGADYIYGGAGSDTIHGGAAADRLFGGAGYDIFSYAAAADSKPGAADIISFFQHGADIFDFRDLPGVGDTQGAARFQGLLSSAEAQSLNAHSAAYLEVEGNTHLLVNTSDSVETVSSTDVRSADMHIVLVGVHLGLTDRDFLV